MFVASTLRLRSISIAGNTCSKLCDGVRLQHLKSLSLAARPRSISQASRYGRLSAFGLGRYASPTIGSTVHGVRPISCRYRLGAVTYFSSNFRGSGQRPPLNNRMAQGAGLLGGAMLLFGKTKYLLVALKFTKLASLGSMVLTIGTYSMFFGWPYAVGMVGLIAVHEAGHAYVLHQKGIPFSPAVFVPFVSSALSLLMKGWHGLHYLHH